MLYEYNIPAQKIKVKDLINHSSKKRIFFKFIALIILLLGYVLYLSYRYGVAQAGLLGLLTWSFFVLCTPIADAGFLLDFPLRVLFKIRMVFSELIVWIIALSLNAFTLTTRSYIYEQTFLSSLLKKILLTPYPYWLIIIISALGTFLSIQLGDELLDLAHFRDAKANHKHAWKFEIFLLFFVFIMSLIAYKHLIREIGINL